MDSQAGRPQLVGSTCVICQNRIGSILEGGWCPECSQSSHFACRKPAGIPVDQGGCGACGRRLSPTTIRGERGRERTEERSRWWDYDLTWVAEICLQVSAFSLLILGVVIWFFFPPDPDARAYVAGSLVLVGLLIEVVIFGLYKRQSWARAAAIGLFIFLIPSYTLPLGLVGLFLLLFHPGTVGAFQGGRKGQSLQERADAEGAAPSAL